MASVSTLTSCTPKEENKIEESVVPVTVETPNVPTENASVEASGQTSMTSEKPAVTRAETVTYATPAGNDPVEFSVTIKDGVITAASAKPKATNEISNKLQTAFSENVAKEVVGKKISDINVTAIGGASLATAAFKTFVSAM